MNSGRRRLSRKVWIPLIAVLVGALAAGGFLLYRIQKPSGYQLHTISFDGSGLRLQSKGLSDRGDPASWSPNGEEIIFEEGGDICTVGTSGGETCLTTGPAADEFPRFSPDGTKIVYSSESDGKLGVWVMNADGSNPELVSNKTDWNPHWSPDGTKIAFTSGRKGAPGIYVINPDGSNETRLTKGGHESGGEFSEDEMFSWSPDGTKIAFTSTRGGGPVIYTMDADGANQKRLVGPRDGVDEDANRPAWSPDGQWIAFERGLGSSFEIWLIRPDGSGLRRLTNDEFEDRAPSWSPDGETIAFMSTRSL